MSGFERFIARRYLFSGQHKALVSFITVISVLGVALGVFALIVVLAVMEGFDANLVEKIIGAYAHIEIVPSPSPGAPALDAVQTLDTLRAMPEVKAAGPVIMRQALLQPPGSHYGGGANRQLGIFVQGVDLAQEHKITSLMKKVRGVSEPEGYEIVLGQKALQQLWVPIGTTVTLFSPTFASTANGRSALVRNVNIAGAFETGFPETDQMLAYTSIESAREMFLIPEGEIDGLHLVLHDPSQADAVCKKIQRALGKGIVATTWRERNPILFDALRLEKWAMFIILLLIVLVAAFNIIGTLIMVVVEKTREIGILKSMGAARASIATIFLWQGMIIGIVGTSLGGALGLTVCYLLKYHIKINILSQAYLSDRIPILLNPWMNALIIVSSLLICLGASLYPARQASKLDPVEALRYE